MNAVPRLWNKSAHFVLPNDKTNRLYCFGSHYELQIHVSSKFYRSSPLAILFMREYFQGGSSDGPVAGIKRIHGTELAEV